MAEARTHPQTIGEIHWREGMLSMPRSRGALSGLAILILGIWVAIVPFVGPYFNYAFLTDQAWYFTYSRLYFDILPGAAAFLGGLMLMASANRPAAGFGAWLAIAAGIWLVIGTTISGLWSALPAIGAPLGGNVRIALEYLGYFEAAGVVIVALAAMAHGRISVRSVRDVVKTREH